MNTTGGYELQMAEEIVSVLPVGSWMRLCSDEREVIRYVVRAPKLALRSVILSRASLRRLMADPAGAVKVEYLQRELLEAAPRRCEFRFPRAVRRAKAAPESGVAAPRVSVL